MKIYGCKTTGTKKYTLRFRVRFLFYNSEYVFYSIKRFLQEKFFAVEVLFRVELSIKMLFSKKLDIIFITMYQNNLDAILNTAQSQHVFMFSKYFPVLFMPCHYLNKLWYLHRWLIQVFSSKIICLFTWSWCEVEAYIDWFDSVLDIKFDKTINLYTEIEAPKI